MEHQKKHEKDGEALGFGPVVILMATSLDRWERCIVDPWRRTYRQETGSIHTVLMPLERKAVIETSSKGELPQLLLSKQCYS